MKPALRRFGEGQHPVVVIDEFSGDVASIVEIAAAMAPFPPCRDSFFPGLRRYIAKEDRAAFAYAKSVLEVAGPFICGAFEYDSFDWTEASFSIVTTPAETLVPTQRVPHYDSANPADLAVLHYLADTPGTAFYRHRLTGIEQVNDENCDSLIPHSQAAAASASGYIHRSDTHYEQIGLVEGVADRLVIYRGSLLHSGLIAPDMPLSEDPRRGRLTANLFVLGR